MTDDAIRERFEKYRDRLLDEAQYFVACAHISKRFREQQIKNPKMFNTASCYWAISMKSVFVSIVLWGEKLFGDHSKSKEMDFWKFLNFVESNRGVIFPNPICSEEEKWGVTPDDIKTHREQIEGLEGVAAIRHLRHKYYAHFDKEFFLNKKGLLDNAEINFASLETMGEIAQEVLLHYSLAYDGIGFSVSATNMDDLTNLFGLIERYFEGQRSRLMNSDRKGSKNEN